MNADLKPNANPTSAVPTTGSPATVSAAPAPASPKPAATPAPAPTLPPPAPLPNPLAHLPLPFEAVDYTFKGYHLEATVMPDQIVAAAQQLDKEGFALDTITGVDWLAAAQMEVIYDYFHPRQFLRVVIKAFVPRGNPQVPTISHVFPGANWHERETHDFFGIHFIGHPNLFPFLLPEDATYHPLRKDFTA